MLIAAVTFIIVLAVVHGVYWALVLRPERQAQAVLRQRLRSSGAGSVVAGASVVRAETALSAVSVFNVLLERSAGLSGPLERLITQSGLPITVGALVLATGLVAAVVFLAVRMTTYFTLLAVAAAAVASFIPYLLVRRARTRRLAMFEEQFPEAIEMMARALRAGHTFQTAVSMVADEMPPPVAPECRLLFDRQNFGMAMGDALKGFAERVPIIDARFFATAVLTQRESGGNLSEVLDNLASVIRARFTVKRQVRVVTAHGRITGWILAALPPTLAGILWMISPDYMNLLLTDALGTQMIAAGITLQVIGTLIIRKLVNVPY